MSDKVEKLMCDLGHVGWEPGGTEDSYRVITSLPVRGRNFQVCAILAELAEHYRPLTLRNLYYLFVSTCTFYDETCKQAYSLVKRMAKVLRWNGVVPFSWIVDNTRTSTKPSSWSGLEDFAETTLNAYRLDFWQSQEDYVELFTEKDSIGGTVQAVTDEYDIRITPLRGDSSDSLVGEVAERFKSINKPIHCYYLGDHDPKGYTIPRSFFSKVRTLSGGVPFELTRIAVDQEDFELHSLHPLKPKRKTKADCTMAARFELEHGSDRCAEVDAIPPDALRGRVRNAIESHIDKDRWEALKRVEAIEQETWRSTIGSLINPTQEGA